MQSNITLRLLSILFHVEERRRNGNSKIEHNKMTLLAIKTFKLKPLYSLTTSVLAYEAKFLAELACVASVPVRTECNIFVARVKIPVARKLRREQKPLPAPFPFLLSPNFRPTRIFARTRHIALRSYGNVATQAIAE